jgi:hypothetical protein
MVARSQRWVPPTTPSYHQPPNSLICPSYLPLLRLLQHMQVRPAVMQPCHPSTCRCGLLSCSHATPAHAGAACRHAAMPPQHMQVRPAVMQPCHPSTCRCGLLSCSHATPAHAGAACRHAAMPPQHMQVRPAVMQPCHPWGQHSTAQHSHQLASHPYSAPAELLHPAGHPASQPSPLSPC